MKERKKNRLQGYDYSRDNLYFITSVVHDRICCFGEIKSIQSIPPTPQMILNQYGQIAQKQWYWLGEQYPYVILHAFIVMPNHIHGIIEINRSRLNILTDYDDGTIVRTGRDLSIKSPIPIKFKSLSELIGAYKTTVSKQIHVLECSSSSSDRSRPVTTTTTTFQW